jgi:hypothetical protein
MCTCMNTHVHAYACVRARVYVHVKDSTCLHCCSSPTPPPAAAAAAASRSAALSSPSPPSLPLSVHATKAIIFAQCELREAFVFYFLRAHDTPRGLKYVSVPR